MKRNIALYGLFAMLTVMIFSCKKQESSPAAPVADYSYVVNGKTVKFTSTSKNATSVSWDFGDGKTGTGDTITHSFDSSSMAYNVTLSATGAGGTKKVSKAVTTLEQYIQIKTSFGEMIMWLYNGTPKHKANFLKLASQNFFDSTTFHRIVQDFVIQGGDPNSKDSDPSNDGFGGPGYTIPAEISSTYKHDYGAIGAARDNNPQKASNGSQFYVVVNKGGDHFLDGNYTVFGMIIKGMEVADKISIQSKDSNNRPLSDIRMDVNILQNTRAEIKALYGYDIR